MNSDDEDFNDIYGDESASTTTVVENKDESNKETVDIKKDSATTGTSSLDQLAALQALSSNLNKVSTPNSNNSNNEASSENKSSNYNNNINNNIDQQGANSSSTSNDKAGQTNGMSWEQLQQTMSQFNPQTSQQQAAINSVKADLSRDICKMFIGGLNWETTEEALKDYFSKYGRVIDLKIMKDTNTGRSRGFGFLTFEEPSSVDEVVKSQHILDGKVIDPKRAIPREEQDKTGKIFVGGIGADVRPKEFEEFFAQWGTIIDAQLMLDKDTGRSRGFGFVTYDSPDAVDKVCQNKFIDFKGKKIEIKRAEPRHMQKQQGNDNSMQQSSGAANPMSQMYQNPMMGGFNPMFNPQAMADYYQKMQEYYQQMQQQTGMDYTQMFQQQMQQMSMMMPGYTMPGMGNAAGSPQSELGTPNAGEDSNSNNNSSSNVQTIGGESSSDAKRSDSADTANDGNENKLQINLPRGPRGPPEQNSHSYGQRDRGDRGDRSDRSDRGDRGDRGDRNDRDYHYRNGNRNNYRGGNNNSGGYRGRGGFSRRNNGYHPYNR